MSPSEVSSSVAFSAFPTWGNHHRAVGAGTSPPPEGDTPPQHLLRPPARSQALAATQVGCGDSYSRIFRLVFRSLSCQGNVTKTASWFCLLESGTANVGLDLEWGSPPVTSGSCQRRDLHTDALGLLIDDMEVCPWPHSFAAY